MSLDLTPSRRLAASGTTPPMPAPVEFRYTQTESFVAVMRELGASLLVSTYQANKLLAVRAMPGGISTLVRTFDRPMGIAATGDRFALGTQSQVWTFRNAPDIAPRIEPQGTHDACYLPRSCHVTGDVGVHEIAWAGDELWLVNTRFSCLCTLNADYSFVPRWRPPFVTALAAEDRCHLNGLAMEEGRVKYVTALGESDTRDGWRQCKAAGGVLIDVTSNEVLLRGLSMPHSPRVQDGQVWLLESGKGQLCIADLRAGRRTTVAAFPGFARGLALYGPYAFIGLSKIRTSSAMDGVPLAERRHELICGIAVVDLRCGVQVALLEFQTAVEEVFDVQVLPNVRCPEVVGFQNESVLHTFVVPPLQRPHTECGGDRAEHPSGALEQVIAAHGDSFADRWLASEMNDSRRNLTAPLP